MDRATCEERRLSRHEREVPGASVGLRLVVEASSSIADRTAEERRLVARCLLGEEAAWETMFEEYHPRLVEYLENLTRQWGGGREQAEEVAAAAWCALYVGAEKALGRYDPQIGSLLRFLKNEARCVFSKWLRAEARGRIRECRVARREGYLEDPGRGLAVEEFLATLTRRERELCLSILLNITAAADLRPVSKTNEYVLRGRIMRKLKNYMVQNN